MDRNHCIDIIAREIAATTHDDEFSREDYPAISEADWEAIANLATQIRASLTPDPTVSRTAYQVLATTFTETEIEDAHPLDKAITYAQRRYTEQNIPFRDPRRRLGLLAATAGEATYASIHSSTLSRLAYVAYQAAWWAAQNNNQLSDMDAIWESVRAEFDRAHRKHDGLTPLSPALSDDFKVAILLEEVGEVARACTPDAHTDIGHAGNLTDELVQVATMACAWAQCILNEEGE